MADSTAPKADTHFQSSVAASARSALAANAGCGCKPMLKQWLSLTAGAFLITLLLTATGCDSMKTLDSVDRVDTKKFMGAWYVIAHIPTFLTNDAYNAVERYRLTRDDTVDVLFTYNEGSFDGELKTMTPTGFPNEGNADGTWGMRFIWPFKADYRITYLDDAYTETIIGRNKRDYVWIMARTPHLQNAEYQALVNRVEVMGYSIGDLRKVPQQKLDERTVPEVAKTF